MDSSTSTSVAAEKTPMMTGDGLAEIQSCSSYTQLHHIGSYPSPIQQVCRAQSHQHGSQQAPQDNPVYHANPNLVHQVNSTHPVHQLNPIQQSNPAYHLSQFTRQLHHYDPTRVNASYSHPSSDVLHHQMEHLHASHLHPAHHYGNSVFSFKR